VWGPAPVSVGNHAYYVSFIDVYSRYTWIYLLKQKSEVSQVFKDFQNFVERKFNRKIIHMQTDWGGEYERLNSFFRQLGISHRVSCPHTHQQNSRAERKHRHIVEVGLSLLSQASMPLKFWDQAFLTATYLINILPSRVLENKTPVELLLKEKPQYTSLRVFGCACWPNLRPYNTRKLAFRSTQCVFLGYSAHHKGFKCLDISEGRFYIYPDVVFDETVYPFATLHPNAGARLRSEILLLPPHLLNSGGDNTFDQFDNGSLRTNPVDEHAGSGHYSSPIATDLGENGVPNHRDFMFQAPLPFSAGTGSDPGEDSPATDPISASDLPPPTAVSSAPSPSAPT